MASSKRLRLLLLLLIPIIFLAWHFAGRRGSKSAVRDATPISDPGLSPPGEQKVLRANAGPVPSYVSLHDAKLQGSESVLEFLLSGKVTSELAEPLPGVTISLRDKRSAPPLISETTDIDGRYTIRLRAPIHAVIDVAKEEYARVLDEVEFIEPGKTIRNYRLLRAPACVEGQVLDLRGKPITGADLEVTMVVRARPLDASSLAPMIGVSGSSGKYRIEGIPEGTGAIAVKSPRHLPDILTIYPKAGDCNQVDFRMTESRTLALTVKNARGETLSEAEATAFGEHIRADDHGEIRFDLPPDTEPYKCTFAAQGYKSKILTLDPKAAPSAVVLEPGEIFAGHAVSESGEAIAGARVEVFDILHISAGKGTTDGEGRFSIALSNSPASSVAVSRPGYLTTRLNLPISSQGPAEEIEICLRRPETGIYGRVIDESGRPVNRFSVTLMGVDPAMEMDHTGGSLRYGGYHQFSFEDDDGKFLVTEIPAGVYLLNITSIPDSAREIRINDPKERVELRKGYYYGEILAQITPLSSQKK